MHKLIEKPDISNNYLAKFENANDKEDIIILHRRDYIGNININDIVNINNIKK